jgi:hypothetical protein
VTSRLRRQLGSIAVLLVAGAATIATSPGPGPGDSTAESIHVALSREQPYDLREVNIVVKHGGHNPNSVWLSLYAEDVDPNHYWVAVIPQDADEPVRPWTETMTYQYQSEPFTLTDWCEQDCERSYLVVIGLASEIESLEADFEVRVSSAYDSAQATPLIGLSTAIEVSENQASDTGVAEIHDEISGQLVVGAGREPVWAGTLDVSGAPAVKDGVGLLRFHLNAAGSDDEARANVALNVDGAYILVDLLGRDMPADVVGVEWLEACDGKAECDLPIQLESSWDPWPENDGSIPQTGSVNVDFTVEARLLFIGAEAVPAGASVDLSAN